MLSTACRAAVLAPTSFTPARLPGVVLLLDASRSPLTMAAGMAASFASATSESLSLDNALLRGGTTWWRSIWVNGTTLPNNGTVFSTLLTNDGMMVALNATPAAVLTVGNGSATKTATSASTLSTATWYHVYFEFDGTNIGLSVNNEAIVQTALTAAFSAGAQVARFGANTTPGNFWDGAMQCAFGGNGTLTTAQRTTIYNGGTPLSYAQTLANGIVPGFAFEFNEPSLTRTDLVAGLVLTDNNTVTTAVGTCLNAVGQWNDLSGLGNNASQATQANKPVLRTSQNGIGGRPALSYDGVDDFLTIAYAAKLAAGNRDWTVVGVISTAPIATNQSIMSRQDTTLEYRFLLNAGNALVERVFDTIGGNTAVTGNVIGTNVPSIVMGGFDLSASQAWVADGIKARTNASMATTPQSGTGTSDIGRDGAGGLMMQGKIAAIYFILNTLTNTQRAQLAQYARRRWGVAA